MLRGALIQVPLSAGFRSASMGAALYLSRRRSRSSVYYARCSRRMLHCSRRACRSSGVQVSTGLNRTANVGRASHTTNLNTATPGANIHGDKPFLVKFQSLISGEGGKNSHMMMYDRQRSFQTYFMRRSAPAIFDSFAKESLERGGYAGLKVRDLNHIIQKAAEIRNLDVPICQTCRRYFAECMLGSPTERQHHVVKTQCLRAMRTWLMQEAMYSFVLTFLIQACYGVATQRRPDSTKRCLPCLDRGNLTSPCHRPRAQSRKRRCSTRSAQAWTT
jgi:hypothetical protein